MCAEGSAMIRGKSRMRENRSYGSVRGVAGDRYPYRDPAERAPKSSVNRTREERDGNVALAPCFQRLPHGRRADNPAGAGSDRLIGFVSGGQAPLRSFQRLLAGGAIGVVMRHGP